jgi:hypothetical protein
MSTGLGGVAMQDKTGGVSLRFIDIRIFLC